MVDRKNFLRNWIMKIGENSVGKSLLFGTYDPLIPDELKREVQKEINSMLIIKKNLFDVIRCFHKTNDEGG